MSQPWTQHENLSKFLSSHDHLKWLHDIERNSFYNVSKTKLVFNDIYFIVRIAKSRFINLPLSYRACS